MHQTIFSLSGTCLYMQLLQESYLYSLSFFANVLWTKSSLFFTFWELNRRCPRVTNKEFKADHFFSHCMADRRLSPSCSWALVASQAAKYYLRKWKTKTGNYFQQWCWAEGHTVCCLGGNVASWITYSFSALQCGSSTLPMAGSCLATLMPTCPKLVICGEADKLKPSLLGYPRASWAPSWGYSAGKRWDIWEPLASAPPKEFWRVLSAC